MLIGSSQNGTQSVTCLQYAGTRTTRLPVYRQGLNHPMLIERNMVNPASRLVEAGHLRKERRRGDGQRNAGESKGHPVIGWIGVAVSTPLRKQADFQHGRSLRDHSQNLHKRKSK